MLLYFQYGTTPLIWACRKGHADIVTELLQHGAYVDNTGMVGYYVKSMFLLWY
jgi:ankyrin repeat-rich membrane spanning protein